MSSSTRSPPRPTRRIYYNEKCPHPRAWEHLYCKPFQMKHSPSCIYQHHRFPVVNSKNLYCKRSQQERRLSCKRCDTHSPRLCIRKVHTPFMHDKKFSFGNFASQIFAALGVGAFFLVIGFDADSVDSGEPAIKKKNSPSPHQNGNL